jgi:hypothetical protein
MEIQFLLGILKEVEADKKRQLHNLVEEQQHLAYRISVMHTELVMHGNFHVVRDLNTSKQKLTRIEYEWLPTFDRQTIVLGAMITRMETILRHRRGRIPHSTWMITYYLNQICAKNIAKNTVA